MGGYLLLRSLLLVGDRFGRAFSGSCVSFGALPTYGEAHTAADATVTANVAQTLDIAGYLTFEVTLYHAVGTDVFGDVAQLCIAPAGGLLMYINFELIEDICSGLLAYTIDIGEGYHSSFVGGDV